MLKNSLQYPRTKNCHEFPTAFIPSSKDTVSHTYLVHKSIETLSITPDNEILLVKSVYRIPSLVGSCITHLPPAGNHSKSF